ncbi:uncharacterized protein LOC133737519 [Rosa rugosa]|uniref:uncharacterized protein LOC133737519 n=1 Tax=Rosa rugosa TaxID=74645 RepID=UPI002B40F944|nr:uncharacterized protein LOC133737519 [Rosa rugosa]
MLIKACNTQLLHPISLGQPGIEISHLFFADDSLFFLKETLQNCEHLSDILHTYCLASGQLINADKSSLYFSPNTRPEIIHFLSSILGMKVVTDPGKYLGLPTTWGRSKRGALAYIKEAVLKKVKGWKQTSLSQAGKEVLIKSVASAIPAYPMLCFKFPLSTCNELNSILSNFWWGNTDSSGIHWKSWDFLSLPKDQGGLGFRNLQSFNDALLAKQAWRLIQDPSSLCARVLKQRYFPNTTLLHARKGGTPSWIWSSILIGRDLLHQGTVWNIGNGSSVNLWSDHWVPMPSPSPICADHIDSSSLVSSLIDWNSKQWDTSRISTYLSADSVRRISAIPLIDPQTLDKLIWPHVKNASEFTVHKKCPSPPHTPSSSTSQSRASHHWQPPPIHALKINTDAAWHSDSLSCGVAAIVRNHHGRVIAGSVKTLSAPSVFAAEAFAMNEGMVLALSFPHRHVELASDSQSLIKSLTTNVPPADWQATNIITQVRYLAQTRQVSWLWTSRSANCAADHLAALACRGKCPVNWLSHPPSSLSEILLYDGCPGPP